MQGEGNLFNNEFRLFELNIGSSHHKTGSIKILAIGGREAGGQDRKINLEKFEINIDHDYGKIILSLKDDVDYSSVDIRANFEISLDADKVKVIPNTIIVAGNKDLSKIECLKILKNTEIQNPELIFNNIAIGELIVEESCEIKSLLFKGMSVSSVDNPEADAISVKKLLDLKIPLGTKIENLSIAEDDCFEALEIGDNSVLASLLIKNAHKLKKIIIGRNCTIGILEITNCEFLEDRMVFLENTKIHAIKIKGTSIREIIFQSNCTIGVIGDSSSTGIDDTTKLLFETGCQIYHQGYEDYVRMLHLTTTHAQKDAEYAIKAKFGEGVSFEIICPRTEISVSNNKRIRDNCVVM